MVPDTGHPELQIGNANGRIPQSVKSFSEGYSVPQAHWLQPETCWGLLNPFKPLERSNNQMAFLKGGILFVHAIG